MNLKVAAVAMLITAIFFGGSRQVYAAPEAGEGAHASLPDKTSTGNGNAGPTTEGRGGDRPDGRGPASSKKQTPSSNATSASAQGAVETEMQPPSPLTPEDLHAWDWPLRVMRHEKAVHDYNEWALDQVNNPKRSSPSPLPKQSDVPEMRLNASGSSEVSGPKSGDDNWNEYGGCLADQCNGAALPDGVAGGLVFKDKRAINLKRLDGPACDLPDQYRRTILANVVTRATAPYYSIRCTMLGDDQFIVREVFLGPVPPQ